MNRFFGSILLAGGLQLAISPALATGQQTDDSSTSATVLLPNERRFSGPMADPLEPRFAIGLALTNLFESRGPERPPYAGASADGTEVQASAAIGATLPLLRLDAIAPGGVIIAAQAGVLARFRIERPSRDDLGQDWMVAMPVEVAWADASARIRIVHRSSHLGDEFKETTGARRIEMGGEAIDGLFGYQLGSVRVYGGGGWIFHSNTHNTRVLMELDRKDRYTLQAGADAELQPFTDRRFSVVAGADWQSAERTNWRSMFGLVSALRMQVGTREARLALRYVGGASALGQFFLTREQVWTLELLLN